MDNPNPKKYVPPGRRGNPTGGSTGATTSEYHATATWSPAQQELKQWLILGGYKKSNGGVFSKKRKGARGNVPYYTVYFADALALSGAPTVKYGVGINIHINKTAGGAWISGIDGSEVKMGEEPDVPRSAIVNEWWTEVSEAIKNL